MATYARAEAVDVRISARAHEGRDAVELADEAEAVVDRVLGRFVWARGTTTWSAAIGEALAVRRWSLATVERGTAGALVALLRGLGDVRHAEVATDDAEPDRGGADRGGGAGPGRRRRGRRLRAPRTPARP